MFEKRILMLAAENDALPGGKVGGVGDVIRDLPRALAKNGAIVDVAIPSYGFLLNTPGLDKVSEIEVVFAKQSHTVEIFCVSIEKNIYQWVFHSPLFYANGEKIYCDDEPGRPFATDATKFAFFNLAVAVAIKNNIIIKPDILHGHDWHAGFIFIIREYLSEFSILKNIKTVFSIHNIAMQGVRPFVGDPSSLFHWFPNIEVDQKKICDRNYPNCVNPVRAAIQIADKIHTVSPTYAKEILQPTDTDNGIYGGDGLEHDLLERNHQGDLHGILNGCEYPSGKSYKAASRKNIGSVMQRCVIEWAGKNRHLITSHWLAPQRIAYWLRRKSNGFTVTSVGRLTDQKTKILQTTTTNGQTVVENILEILGKDGTFIVLGSGDPSIEDFFTEMSSRYSNLIFLNGYSNKLSKYIYNFGDLFLMPSSFEPCGISQLLAMRAGQPCLVNSVGGLKDTVAHNKTGFVFDGANIAEQADALLTVFQEVFALFQSDREKWTAYSRAASQERFTWDKSAQDYIEQLYQ